jgi:DNA-binding MarR family transcriptional regulator
MPRERNLNRNDIELLVAMLKLVSLISRPMRDSVADPAGLSANELRILMALSGQVESAGHSLAELMGMHAMNVSRALAALHAMGLIEPLTGRGNRRRKPYRVSARGAKTHAALEENLGRVARFLFEVLTAEERASLRRIVGKLDRQVLTWQPSERRPHVPRA